jgi:hypothetical protein
MSHSAHEEKCAPMVHINNVQLSQGENNVKNLRLHLDRKLTSHKHIFTKWKQLGIGLNKMYWLLGRKSQLSTKETNNTQTNLDLEYNSGVWLPLPTKKS